MKSLLDFGGGAEFWLILWSICVRLTCFFLQKLVHAERVPSEEIPQEWRTTMHVALSVLFIIAVFTFLYHLYIGTLLPVAKFPPSSTIAAFVNSSLLFSYILLSTGRVTFVRDGLTGRAVSGFRMVDWSAHGPLLLYQVGRCLYAQPLKEVVWPMVLEAIYCQAAFYARMSVQPEVRHGLHAFTWVAWIYSLRLMLRWRRAVASRQMRPGPEASMEERENFRYKQSLYQLIDAAFFAHLLAGLAYGVVYALEFWEMLDPSTEHHLYCSIDVITKGAITSLFSAIETLRSFLNNLEIRVRVAGECAELASKVAASRSLEISRNRFMREILDEVRVPMNSLLESVTRMSTHMSPVSRADSAAAAAAAPGSRASYSIGSEGGMTPSPSMFRPLRRSDRQLDSLGVHMKNIRSCAQTLSDALCEARVLERHATQPEALHLRLRLTKFDPRKLVSAVLLRMFHSARQKGLRLKVVDETRCEQKKTKVLGDFNKLCQVLCTGVSRAIESTPEGGSVTISLRLYTPERFCKLERETGSPAKRDGAGEGTEDHMEVSAAKLVVEVLDTGEGLDKRQLGQLRRVVSLGPQKSEAGERTPQAQTPESSFEGIEGKGGKGEEKENQERVHEDFVGALDVAREIMKAHDGMIVLTSDGKGEGCLFRIDASLKVPETGDDNESEDGEESQLKVSTTVFSPMGSSTHIAIGSVLSSNLQRKRPPRLSSTLEELKGSKSEAEGEIFSPNTSGPDFLSPQASVQSSPLPKPALIYRDPTLRNECKSPRQRLASLVDDAGLPLASLELEGVLTALWDKLPVLENSAEKGDPEEADVGLWSLVTTSNSAEEQIPTEVMDSEGGERSSQRGPVSSSLPAQHPEPGFASKIPNSLLIEYETSPLSAPQEEEDAPQGHEKGQGEEGLSPNQKATEAKTGESRSLAPIHQAEWSSTAAPSDLISPVRSAFSVRCSLKGQRSPPPLPSLEEQQLLTETVMSFKTSLIHTLRLQAETHVGETEGGRSRLSHPSPASQETHSSTRDEIDSSLPESAILVVDCTSAGVKERGKEGEGEDEEPPSWDLDSSNEFPGGTTASSRQSKQRATAAGYLSTTLLRRRVRSRIAQKAFEGSALSPPPFFLVSTSPSPPLSPVGSFPAPSPQASPCPAPLFPGEGSYRTFSAHTEEQDQVARALMAGATDVLRFHREEPAFCARLSRAVQSRHRELLAATKASAVWKKRVTESPMTMQSAPSPSRITGADEVQGTESLPQISHHEGVAVAFVDVSSVSFAEGLSAVDRSSGCSTVPALLGRILNVAAAVGLETADVSQDSLLVVSLKESAEKEGGDGTNTSTVSEQAEKTMEFAEATANLCSSRATFFGPHVRVAPFLAVAADPRRFFGVSQHGHRSVLWSGSQGERDGTSIVASDALLQAAGLSLPQQNADLSSFEASQAKTKSSRALPLTVTQPEGCPAMTVFVVLPPSDVGQASAVGERGGGLEKQAKAEEEEHLSQRPFQGVALGACSRSKAGRVSFDMSTLSDGRIQIRPPPESEVEGEQRRERSLRPRARTAVTSQMTKENLPVRDQTQRHPSLLYRYAAGEGNAGMPLGVSRASLVMDRLLRRHADLSRDLSREVANGHAWRV
uniref:Histidine kinase/HSP90-like ATPase domain-containing protein n=1 Tax=Chromera velia CCMP2878 TaxID=1169474 RepID=A0A0G4HD49_9ALVE|eukprot:Cvel_6411.t1-p1 / transcript=Cvel_6411.t1 / gene=Cvel_6411 / organism=Chromera_velia_CCMP2878 / gene_product=hypothetical protein / transcript_product=hypothetical protein / location=Cvel_scaffold313:59999-71257(-) / protein_length=1616 / sequence_SO=supercontig / SO=protein_coding / is_pseudo=false